jgi:alpha-beta hydrolase superfamily lysophospholipase
VFLLGHSAGGVVSCRFTLNHPAELGGLICESFAFKVPAPVAALKEETLKHYDGHFHDLLNDSSNESVLADIRARIEARTPP